MRVLFLWIVVNGLFFVCGCEKKQAQPPTQGLEIRVPGVDVTLDKDHGLHVKAGETDVKVNKEKGVNVKAPGVEVETKREKSGDE